MFIFFVISDDLLRRPCVFSPNSRFLSYRCREVLIAFRGFVRAAAEHTSQLKNTHNNVQRTRVRWIEIERKRGMIARVYIANFDHHGPHQPRCFWVVLIIRCVFVLLWIKCIDCRHERVNTIEKENTNRHMQGDLWWWWMRMVLVSCYRSLTFYV